MFACWLGLLCLARARNGNLIKSAGAVFLPDVDVVRPGSDLPLPGSGSAFIAGAPAGQVGALTCAGGDNGYGGLD